ncbi:NADH-quinone oxidoreductase subunit N, partial [Streptomyces sp. OspMP-M43]
GAATAPTASAPPRRFRAPTPLTTAIVLTATAGILLSGVPQTVLRFASVSLF